VPELPEVQTVVDSLQPLKNKYISSFFSYDSKVIYNYNSTINYNKILSNTKISSIRRIGKFIIIKTGNIFLAFHLRMTGYLYSSTNYKENKYTRCYFILNDKTHLCFEDVRKFGGFYFLKTLKLIDNKIGIDPLNKDFTSRWLKKNILKKKCKIKSLLFNQKFICGLGNIYIDEILWKSKIHPLKKTSSLSEINITNLHKYIISILKKSIQYHGTTIINFKFDNMKTGLYKNKLHVYGRETLKCSRCNHTIRKIRVCNRGTYICTNCQKL